ncbi:MAG TPA: ABC transporter permease [Clostridiaceae bacterium]|nr:ABC transporter permease [Clostridiaceae bacterium]
MLKKLLKHEIKATSRLFLPLYLALLIFAFINRFLNPMMQVNTSDTSVSVSINAHEMLSAFSVMIYIALIIGTFVMTLVITVQRFYRNLLGEEGYLMFTLPVKTWMHIVSKLLVSMIWVFSSFLTTFCSILILIHDKGIIEQIFQILNALKDFLGYGTVILIPLLILIWVAANISMIYSAISLGQLFESHKLIISFGMYCALYFVFQGISALFILLFRNTLFASFFSLSVPTPQDIKTLLLSFSLLLTIFASVNFTITNLILKKRLNLD